MLNQRIGSLFRLPIVLTVLAMTWGSLAGGSIALAHTAQWDMVTGWNAYQTHHGWCDAPSQCYDYDVSFLAYTNSGHTAFYVYSTRFYNGYAHYGYNFQVMYIYNDALSCWEDYYNWQDALINGINRTESTYIACTGYSNVSTQQHILFGDYECCIEWGWWYP